MKTKIEISKSTFIFLLSYIGAIILSIFVNTPKIFETNKYLVSISSNRLNIVLILLPLIAIVVTYYISELKNLIREFGKSLVDKFIPQKQKRLQFDLLLYVLLTVLVTVLDDMFMLVVFVFHSAYICMIIFESISELNEDIVLNYVENLRENQIDLIGLGNIEFKISDISEIGRKSVLIENEELFVASVRTLSALTGKILEKKNTLLSYGLTEDEINKKAKVIYKSMITITEFAAKRDFIQFRKNLLDYLSKPLIDSSKYNNISEFNTFIDVVRQKFVVNPYIDKGSVEANVIIDLYDIAFKEMFDTKLSNDWVDSVLDSIQDLLLFVAMSSESSIKTSLSIMVNELRSSECSKDNEWSGYTKLDSFLKGMYNKMNRKGESPWQKENDVSLLMNSNIKWCNYT